MPSISMCWILCWQRFNMCISWGCRETEPRLDRYNKRASNKIYFKELAHMIMEAGESKIWRVSWQARDLRSNWWCSSGPKANYCGIPSCLGRPVFLFYSDFQLMQWDPNYEGKSALFKAHWLKNLYYTKLPSQFSQSVNSVTHSCLTLCDPMNCSMPGLPAHHQLMEFT